MRFVYRSPRLISGLLLSSLFACLLVGLDSSSANAADYPFPIIGSSSYSNDYEAPRASGPHHATDIFASKRQKIVSRTDGTVSFVGYPQPSWGFAVFVRADNGNEYWYLHMNNDTPGTDDGNGDGYFAYGPDVQAGKRVVKGQLLGYVGDSGNAETTAPHLHFEVYNDDNETINPYDGLRNNSYRISTPIKDYPKAANEQLPYGSFTGGASISYGDTDGDGVDEIVTGAGPGGKYVKIFEQDGSQITRFAPNGTSFTGGVDVATGDVDNDGVDEIVTGAGPGGKYVKVFETNGTPIRQFTPYGNSSVGITVTTGDISGDTTPEIITGARKGGGPRVSIFSSNGTQIQSYYAYDSSLKGGIRVASANMHTSPSNTKDEVLVALQSQGPPRVKMFSQNGASMGYSNYFAEEWWKGYYDIATVDDKVLSSTGVNRRTSLRLVTGL